MRLSPPNLEFNPGDPNDNVAAWTAEWNRVHPALRWMIGFAFFIAVIGGMGLGLVLALILQ
jgi:hypothetical protein